MKMLPKIIPIKDLKNTGEISELCHQSKEPIVITKNGYSDMVIMSVETYQKEMFMNHIRQDAAISEKQIAGGEVYDMDTALEESEVKYGLNS